MQKNRAYNLIQYIILAGLASSPFIFWFLAKVPFEIPKVWFIQRWIELLGIFTVFLFPYVYHKGKRDNLLIILVLLFLFTVFISSLFGENLSKSFWGNYYRGDGIYTLIHLIIFFLVILLTVRKEFLPTLFKAISFSSLVLSAVTIILSLAYYLFDYQLTYFPAWEGAFGGFFGNPNFLAGYLLVTLPFFFSSFKKNKLWLFSSLAISAIILTKAWAGVLGALIFFLFQNLFTNPKRIFVPVLFLIILIATGFVYYKYTPSFNYRSSFAAESRERIFMKGYLAFKERPITGWGWANFDHAFDKIIWPEKFYHDVYVDKAHSNFLEILVTSGIAGFTIYLLLLSRIFINLYRHKSHLRIYLLLSFILFVYHSQTNVISISEELMFWLLAGVSAVKS